MPATKTQPARGMRDFLPADVRKREYVIGVIKEVYERYGFEPLETPAVENIETLMGKYGEEGNQLIFKILKRGEHEKTGEADLALRYDLTVPLARVVAQYQNELPKFFKRYQIQPVWRADRPARGRFREFYQCDVDVLGSRSMVVEAELCAAVRDVFDHLGFSDFIIRLNHRKILSAILDASNIPSQLHAATLTALDKYEKIGPDQVVEELVSAGVSQESCLKLLNLLIDATARAAELFRRAEGTLETAPQPLEDAKTVQQAVPGASSVELIDANESILERIAGYTFPSEEAGEAIQEIKQVLCLIKDSPASGKVVFDLTLARGLSYYTGAIMEVNVPDLAGSLGGGGRYDNLVGMFLGKDVPACGFSLGLERIIVVMTERNMFPAELVSSPADVMVTIWNEDSIAESMALATELRSKGMRVDLYPEADKMGKQFKYASARGIPFVAVVGDDERTRGEVAIKDMKSGEQRSVKREDVADAVGIRKS